MHEPGKKTTSKQRVPVARGVDGTAKFVRAGNEFIHENEK